jgi:hypothetical protein
LAADVLAGLHTERSAGVGDEKVFSNDFHQKGIIARGDVRMSLQPLEREVSKVIDCMPVLWLAIAAI